MKYFLVTFYFIFRIMICWQVIESHTFSLLALSQRLLLSQQNFLTLLLNTKYSLYQLDTLLIHHFFKYFTKVIVLFIFYSIQFPSLFILREEGGGLFAFQLALAKGLDDLEEMLYNYYVKLFLLNLVVKLLASVAYEAANI